jgi:DNA-binding transcriptional ArsR family regulator
MEVSAKRKPDEKARGAILKGFLSNWLRWEIWTTCDEREASASQLAEMMGKEYFQRINYHLHALEKAGLVEMVRVDCSSGPEEKFYKATVRPIVDVRSAETMPRPMREFISSSILDLFWGDIEKAVSSGTIDAHPMRTLMRECFIADDQALTEMAEECEAHHEHMRDIQARALGRLVERGEHGMRVSAFTSVVPLSKPE